MQFYLFNYIKEWNKRVWEPVRHKWYIVFQWVSFSFLWLLGYILHLFKATCGSFLRGSSALLFIFSLFLSLQELRAQGVTAKQVFKKAEWRIATERKRAFEFSVSVELRVQREAMVRPRPPPSIETETTGDKIVSSLWNVSVYPSMSWVSALLPLGNWIVL